MTAYEKIGAGLKTARPSFGPETQGEPPGSVFMRNGPGAMHNISGMTQDQVDALNAEWQRLPAAAKVGMRRSDRD